MTADKPRQIPFVDYLELGDSPHLVAHECKACGARLCATARALHLAREQGLQGGDLPLTTAALVEGVTQPLDVCTLRN